MTVCQTCHQKPPEPGTAECYRCRISSVGFRLQGGGVLGRANFHQSKREFLEEHLGASSEKELAKRPEIARTSDFDQTKNYAEDRGLT